MRVRLILSQEVNVFAYSESNLYNILEPTYTHAIRGRYTLPSMPQLSERYDGLALVELPGWLET